MSWCSSKQGGEEGWNELEERVGGRIEEVGSLLLKLQGSQTALETESREQVARERAGQR